MPDVLLPHASLPEAPEFAPLRISVDRYHHLVASGLLTEDDDVELLEGLVVPKMGKNPPHSFVTWFLESWLKSHIGPDWLVRNQEPITLSDSEPEPDLAVIQGLPAAFFRRHPGPSEIGLVVEVADSSLLADRRKARIYARERLPECWIVNLPDRSVEVYRRPEGVGAAACYAELVVYRVTDALPVSIGGRSVGSLAVCELFPADTDGTP